MPLPINHFRSPLGLSDPRVPDETVDVNGGFVNQFAQVTGAISPYNNNQIVGLDWLTSLARNPTRTAPIPRTGSRPHPPPQQQARPINPLPRRRRSRETFVEIFRDLQARYPRLPPPAPPPHLTVRRSPPRAPPPSSSASNATTRGSSTEHDTSWNYISLVDEEAERKRDYEATLKQLVPAERQLTNPRWREGEAPFQDRVDTDDADEEEWAAWGDVAVIDGIERDQEVEEGEIVEILGEGVIQVRQRDERSMNNE